jgi:antitoxin (DNA-binding transcriptional repressor) of toxin-antitoxin stability system
MDIPVTATEAARTFADLVNRVRYRGESFVVERAGEPVCRISPASAPRRTLADLVRVLKALPRPDRGYLDDVSRAQKRQPRLPKNPWGR